MPIQYGILFFLILGFQIAAIFPLKITKMKFRILFLLLSLPLYIIYEAYFQQPEVLATVPIRVDFLILHPIIIAAFAVNILRSIIMIKKKEQVGFFVLAVLLGSFIYWWYYIIVVCMFYR